MRLRVNGNIIDSSAKTVLDLLKGLGIDQRGVAVEVNMRVLKRDEYKDFYLSDGDTIEIVKFVGGGYYG